MALTTPGVRNLAGSTAARLPDGRILVAGGAGSTPSGSSIAGTTSRVSTAELYDPVTGTWSQLPPMPEARAGATAVALGDESVLLIGGNGGYDDEEGLTLLTSAIRFVPSQ